ncbi:MAG: hypothetical protein GY913_10290 [Proteobacteria bacterium]|nr:hypothetical protein [Pseudomonadota bacterium]MCP4917301.1 hypothetical protein [Pseudomonadota bacterium]
MTTSILLFSLVASGDKDTDVTADSGDVTTDSGDTSSDTGEPAEVHECLAAHGIQAAGSSWVYAWQSSSRTGNRTAEVVGYDPDARTATVKTIDTWTDAGGQYSYFGTEWKTYACTAEGIALTEDRDEYSGSNAGQAYSGDVTTVYDPPALVRTNAPAVGDSWTGTYTGTETDADGYESAISKTIDSEVLDDGIPLSGGWEGTQIRDHYSAESYSDYHWMAEVGVIRTPTAYITAYTP